MRLKCHYYYTKPKSRIAVSEFWATVCKTIRPILSDRCLSDCSVCLSVTLVHCGQTVRWVKIKLGMQVGLSPGQIVLDRDPAPTPTERGTAAPTYEIYVCRLCLRPYNPRPMSIVVKRLDGSRYHLVRRSRPRSRQHCVRWGPAPPKKGIAAPTPILGPW